MIREENWYDERRRFFVVIVTAILSFAVGFMLGASS